MTSRTTTRVTHYHVQKKRRADFIEEWRGHQKTVVRLSDVAMAETAPGVRRGVYVGADGDRPTRTMDALAHERHLLPTIGAAIEHARQHVRRALPAPTG